LTFFSFPEEEWISLRTTNIIERLNKEFKRRTKPMEIVAGERACYTLLAFISIKMELHWRSNPIGKVRNNLPFFKELAHNNFTQLN
jgi:putative transposase